jgi:predicted TIM-barrel fold metal-dependent hydrolase
MKVIDMDSHSVPREQDYFIEPEYSHLKPRAYVDAKGTRRVIFNNQIRLVAARGEKGMSYKREDDSDRRRAYYDGSVRYEQITKAGIDFQLIMAGGGPTDFNYIDAPTGAAFCRAYNDFLYKTFMKPYPKAFSGLPALPIQSIPEAIKELERCVNDLGMISFVMPTNWNGIDMADPYWWNFYDKVREFGVTTLVIHIDSIPSEVKWVGKERLKVLGPDGTRGRRIVATPFEYCTNIINLIYGGLMDSFPEFNFLFLEGCTEFAIPLKRRITETMEQLSYLQEMLSQPLQKYFERLYFLVDDPLLEDDGEWLKRAIKEFGPDHLLFGSDYPHEDSLQMSERLTAITGISADVQEKILSKNAMALLGLK